MRTSTILAIIAFIALNIHFSHLAWWSLLGAVGFGLYEGSR